MIVVHNEAAGGRWASSAQSWAPLWHGGLFGPETHSVVCMLWVWRSWAQTPLPWDSWGVGRRRSFSLCLHAWVPTVSVSGTRSFSGNVDAKQKSVKWELWSWSSGNTGIASLLCSQVLGFIAKGSYGPIMKVKDNFNDKVFAVKVSGQQCKKRVYFF